MIRNVSLFAIALSCCASARATDFRIRTLPYDPQHIVRVSGRPGIQSTIEFASDERIENIAVGDSAAWQVTPNRRASLIFLKPLVATSRSNMTVVTDRRTYMFDLVTSRRGDPPLYSLRFSYAEGEIRPVDTLHQPVAPPAAAAPVIVAAPVRPEQFNFGWTSKGAANLLPERVFDDGSALYLAWHRDVPLPAILTLSDDHSEATLNYRVDGEYIVVSPIPSNIMLRYANKQASVWPSVPARAVRGAVPVLPRLPEAPRVAKSVITTVPTPPAVAVPQAIAEATSANFDPNLGHPEIASLSGGRLAYPKTDFNDQLTDSEHDK